MQQAHLKCSSMGVRLEWVLGWRRSGGGGEGGGSADKHPLHTRCPLRDSQSDFCYHPSSPMVNHTHTFHLLQSNQIESWVQLLCLVSLSVCALPSLMTWFYGASLSEVIKSNMRPLQKPQKKEVAKGGRNLNGKATSCRRDEREKPTTKTINVHQGAVVSCHAYFSPCRLGQRANNSQLAIRFLRFFFLFFFFFVATIYATPAVRSSSRTCLKELLQAV